MNDTSAYCEPSLWHYQPVLAHVGDWTIREDASAERGYALSCYGNFRGWFETAEDIETAFPHERGRQMAQKVRDYERKLAQVRLSI